MNNLIAISCFSASVVAVTASNTLIDSDHWMSDFLFLGVALLSLVMLLLVGRATSTSWSYALLPFMGIGLTYLISTVATPAENGIKNTALVLFCSFIYFSCRAHSRLILSSSFCLITVLGCNLFLFGWLLSHPGLLDELFPKNFAGWAGFYLTGISMILTLSRLSNAAVVVFVASSAMFCFSLLIDHRTMVLLSFAFPVLFFGLKWFWLSNLCKTLIIMVVFLMSAATVWVVVVPSEILDRIDHQAQSVEGGRRARSGRDRIWPELVSIISERPLTGYGSGEIPKDYSVEFGDLSSHNLFLQVTFQVGVAGVALLVWLIYGVWRDITFVHHAYNPAVVGAALTIYVVANNTLEVSLLQSKMSIAFFTWMALGLAAGFSNSLVYRRQEYPSISP